MANFTNLTLLQGLELVLTSPEFPEGRDIVQTLEQLIADNQIVKEGKVATIISERTSEKDQLPDGRVTPSVNAESSRETVIGAETPIAARVETGQEVTLVPTGISSEMLTTMNRFEKLPDRYHRLFEQLLASWEKQSGTSEGLNPSEKQ